MNGQQPAFASWLDDTNEITRMFLGASQIPDLVNLAGGLPESSTFPTADLAELANRAIAENGADALAYSPIEGNPALRDRIAARFGSERLKLDRSNVLIVAGGMQGLDLVGKVLLDSGDIVAAQTPAYLGALDAWRPRQPRYRPFFPDQPRFDPRHAFSDAKFAYTVPNFSNPTGKLVGTDVRQAMVRAALDLGTWVLEDDPYGSLYYDHSPLNRMIDIAGSVGADIYRGPVIYMGTFSKTICPGLRIGWVIARPDMIEALTIAKQGTDLCTSGLNQQIAVELLDAGLVEKNLPRILSKYKERRDVLCAALEKYLGDHFEWEVPVGGMFVWAVARSPDMNTDDLLKFSLDHGVCVSPSSVFDPDGADRSGIRINFTYNAPDRLTEGIRRLARAVEAMTG